MGIVLKGYDSATARTVAIKVLAPVWASNPISRERSLREARAVAALSDEDILPIFSVDDDGSYPVIVMPFIDDETLEQCVQRRGPLKIFAV